MKRITSLFLTFILAVSFAFNISPSYAEEDIIPEEPEEAITEINLTNVGDFQTMTKKEILTLTCDVESDDIAWTTSSRKIASVDQEGNVRALKNGKAIITCYLLSDPTVRDSVSIRVGTKVTGVAIKEKNEFIKIDTSRKVAFAVYPKKASNKALVWESSNPEVLEIGPGNVIKAVSIGTSVVTCTTTDGTNLSTSFEYTVYDYPVQEESIFLAHRGDMQSAPENTLPAFQSAIDRGYKYIEFDVQQSSVSPAAPVDPEEPENLGAPEEPEDPVLIIMHDTTLKRMTGKKGYVHQLTRENINSYPIKKGTNIKKYGKKLKIPTLEETLDLIFSADHEVVPCIHIKEPSAGHPGLTRAGIQKILDLCKGHEIKILCRNIDDLNTISELSGPDDNIELWASSLTLGYPNVVDLVQVCEENGLDIKGLTFSQKNLLEHPEFIEQAHARGYMVDVYGIANTYQYLKFKKMGVDRMTCNVKVFKDAE